jgi:transcriptional regulator with XRE-family HTH domain
VNDNVESAAGCKYILFVDRSGSRRRTVALPFCHRVFITSKPKSPKYPKELKTLGDHIRKRRLDLKLFQKQVAAQIAVDTTMIYNLERNATSPQIHVLPQIIRFLAYNSLPAQESLAEKLLLTRRVIGLTQKEMAKRMGLIRPRWPGWNGGRAGECFSRR